LQYQVIAVLERTLGRRVAAGPTPEWLLRPGKTEAGPLWRTIRRIYRELTDGLELPDEAPFREWREVDGMLGLRHGPARLVEVDEAQHFNEFRAMTLAAYPKDIGLAFPKAVWLRESKSRRAIGGGGWAKPKPPLFPMAGGRHHQRAFRDALADLLPSVHGYAPTLRIADFEVEPWIWERRGAMRRLGELIEERMASGGNT